MAEPVSANVAMLMRVADRLNPLLDCVVFLGGAVTELLITSAGASGPRQTDDVDIVVNVLNLGEYSETLRDELLSLGLVEDTRDGAPVCRWLMGDVMVDIMPTRGDILDFSCEWYQTAFDSAEAFPLPNGLTIRLISPACFLATKLAAFGDRGPPPVPSKQVRPNVAFGKSVEQHNGCSSATKCLVGSRPVT